MVFEGIQRIQGDAAESGLRGPKCEASSQGDGGPWRSPCRIPIPLKVSKEKPLPTLPTGPLS